MAFLERDPTFQLKPYADVGARRSAPSRRTADGRTDTLLLTPSTHGTDGFFIAIRSEQGIKVENEWNRMRTASSCRPTAGALAGRSMVIPLVFP